MARGFPDYINNPGTDATLIKKGLAGVGGRIIFDTEAAFVAADIAATTTSVETLGYYTRGDGGGHIKTKLVAPPSPVRAWHKQSIDGAWWAIISTQITGKSLGAVGNGVADDSTPYTGAELANSAVFLAEGASYSISGTPTKPVYGPGSLVSGGITRDGALPVHLTDRSSIRIAPRGKSADDWLLGAGQTPSSGNHGNVLIGVGINNPDQSSISRTTAIGSLILTKGQQIDRVSVVGQGSLRFTKFGERIDALGSLIMQWGGGNLADDPTGNFYRHSVIFNGDAGPTLALGSPGAYTLNPAYNAGTSAFNLDPADGQTVIDWMNTTPWVTDTSQFAYNQGFGRDCLNNFMKGYGNVAYGYRAGAILLEGNDNTLVGNNALGNTLFSSGNVAVGHTAGFQHKTGDNNVYVGNMAGYRHKTGGSSIFIGSNAGSPTNTFAATWSIFIGLDAGIRPDGTSPATMDNKLIIQDRYTRNPLLNGTFGTPNGKLGINLPIDIAPRGTLHAYSEASGFAGTVGTGADDLIVENNDNVGLTFLSPNTATATIGFGDSDLALSGFIQYLHTTNVLRFGINGSTKMQLKSNTLNITSIPTSSSGLSSGDIWSNSGVLTIVP